MPPKTNMDRLISRRAFLKGGAASTAALAATALPAAAGAPEQNAQLATLIDIEKCMGCQACVEACREKNQANMPKVKKPFPPMVPRRAKPEDWSEQQDLTDRLTPYNWLFVQNADVTVNGRETTLNIPRRCMHCINPPCVKLCPWGAARQLPNGISRIDPDICLGGSKCKAVCPWHIPQRQSGVGLYLDILPSMAGNGVMYKCDRCYDRIKNNELPACIAACPEGAQIIGPREEILQTARERARQINGHIYGDRENGGTNTVYVSPVPFETLNAAIEKGNGRPDLTPKSDAMADGNNLLTALAVAPIAGALAAITKFYRFTCKNGEQEWRHWPEKWPQFCRGSPWACWPWQDLPRCPYSSAITLPISLAWHGLQSSMLPTTCITCWPPCSWHSWPINWSPNKWLRKKGPTHGWQGSSGEFWPGLWPRESWWSSGICRDTIFLLPR